MMHNHWREKARERDEELIRRYQAKESEQEEENKRFAKMYTKVFEDEERRMAAEAAARRRAREEERRRAAESDGDKRQTRSAFQRKNMEALIHNPNQLAYMKEMEQNELQEGVD